MARAKKISLTVLAVVVVAIAALVIIKMKSTTTVPEHIETASVIEVEKGKIAPGFAHENLLGEDMSLADFRGNLLVLAFAFSKDTAKDIENFRGRIYSDFMDQGVNCLKFVHINKPLFITKKFIRRKMRREFGSDEALRYLIIDWGGTLELDTKYSIKDKDSPTLFVIGSEGEILYALKGWYSEDNIAILEKEISTILDSGEDTYLDKTGGTHRKTYRIGVTRIMYHRCFELSQKGFKSALEEAGYIEGRNIAFDFQDAGADPDEVVNIANRFISDNVDLIHSMSIMGSQILVDVVKEIPVVYSMVMNPIEEKVVPTMGPSGTNVTGVAVRYCALADRWPVDTQFELYSKFIPEAGKWGTIYNSGSVNTMFHIKEIRQTSENLGLELVEAPVTEAGEVRKAAESLVGKVDAVYITSDEIAMSAFEDIADVCNRNNIPLFGGELECVQRGALAAYNEDYFLPGYRAGKLAVRILQGEKPGKIPSETTKKFHLVISLKNAETQGVTVPKELKEKADRIL